MSSSGVFRCLVLLLAVMAALPLAFNAQQAQAFGPETQLSDMWFRTRPARAPRADMVIVARDQKTVDAMGQPTHADYGATIRKLKAAGAKWIVLDLDLDDRQGRELDRKLYTAIADSHRTLVLVRYAQKRTAVPDPDELRGLRALEKSAHWQEFAVKPGTPEWGWLNFAPATSDFIHSAHGAGVAVTEQSLDPDAVLRRSRAGYIAKVLYPADTKQGKLTNFLAVVPSLPVVTAVSVMGGDKYALKYRFGENLNFGGAAVQPLDQKGFIPVDFIGPEMTYPRVPMVDVIRSEPRADLFKDKIVFIGSTIPTDDLTEYRLTPFGSRMPRVEITANQVQSFLDQRPLAESHVAGFWSVMMLGLLLGLLVPAFRMAPSVLAGLLALALYLGVGWFLFGQRSLMLPLIPAFILTAVVILVSVALSAWMHPYAVGREVEVRDTGMAVGAGETLPDAPPRSRNPFRRRQSL